MRILNLLILLAIVAVVGCSVKAQSLSEQERYNLAADYSAKTRGLSVLILKGDKIVFEQYQNGHSAETPHLLASGTKSFSGVLAMMAQEEGLLKLDEKVSDTITEWKSDARKSQITIRQILSLTSGIQSGNLGRPPAYSAAVEFDAVAEPGKVFQYGPAPFQIFGELLHRKLAPKNETVGSYMKRKILDSLGIKVANWNSQNGEPNLPSGASLTAREWLKYGIFLKNGGAWQGRQLISKKSLDECLKGSAVNPNYGLTFWLNRSSDGNVSIAENTNERRGRLGGILGGDGGDMGTTRMSKKGLGANVPPDTFMAAGAANQRLYIIPSMDLVIVRQGQLARYDDNEFLSLLLFGKK